MMAFSSASFGHYRAGQDTFFQKRHHLFAAVPGQLLAFGVDRRGGAVAGQRHADSLAQAGHRVGGAHHGARARPRVGALFHFNEFGV